MTTPVVVLLMLLLIGLVFVLLASSCFFHRGSIRIVVLLCPVRIKPGLKNTNKQIPVKTSNPGWNPSYYTVSSTGFASFDRSFSSGEFFDRNRSKTSIAISILLIPTMMVILHVEYADRSL